MSIIDEFQPLLKRIDHRLASIERQLVGQRSLADVVSHHLVYLVLVHSVTSQVAGE